MWTVLYFCMRVCILLLMLERLLGCLYSFLSSLSVYVVRDIKTIKTDHCFLQCSLFFSDTRGRMTLSASEVGAAVNRQNCAPPLLINDCNRNLCYHLMYRSFDGTCNNLQNPLWGAAFTQYVRNMRPQYDDGNGAPIGTFFKWKHLFSSSLTKSEVWRWLTYLRDNPMQKTRSLIKRQFFTQFLLNIQFASAYRDGRGIYLDYTKN